MEESKDTRRIIIQAYKDQVINAMTDLRIIFFKKDELFVEINPNTYRPLNSIFWKTVNSDEYYNIFSYLKYHYDKIINFIPDNITEIGVLANNIFVIDTNLFDSFIMLNENKFFNIERVLVEYRNLIDYSTKFYNQWYSIISNYLDCVNLFFFFLNE